MPLLVDVEHYPQWWQQVLAVSRIDDDTARVLCRSTLRYALDLVLRAVRREPTVLASTIEGDLVGEARWRLSAGAYAATRLGYEQRIDVTGTLARPAARLLGPAARWNHHRMMVGCREGLRSLLAG